MTYLEKFFQMSMTHNLLGKNFFSSLGTEKKIFQTLFHFTRFFSCQIFFSNWFFFFAHFDMIAKFIRNVGKCAKKQSVVIIVLTNLFGKKSPRVNKIFFQVTLVEKGHLGNISRPWPSASASKTFPWCPFSTSVTWKKILFTLGLFFLTICPDNYDNKILFLHSTGSQEQDYDPSSSFGDDFFQEEEDYLENDSKEKSFKVHI